MNHAKCNNMQWEILLLRNRIHYYYYYYYYYRRFVACTYPPCWVLKSRIQKHQGKPLLFHDKCPGFFYVHYTTHRTYSFTSHPKDEAIMVKCLAQGHKRRDWPGRDSNPHSDDIKTWVQCTGLFDSLLKWLLNCYTLSCLQYRQVKVQFILNHFAWPICIKVLHCFMAPFSTTIEQYTSCTTCISIVTLTVILHIACVSTQLLYLLQLYEVQ